MNPRESNLQHAPAHWPAEDIPDLEEFLRRLLCDPAPRVFHGSHESWGELLSSFDYTFRDTRREEALELETRLLEEFGQRCFRHLPPGARRHIELARLEWNSYRTTATVFVGRHYGLPTRCLDWSADAFVALFFACRREPAREGVVWWMCPREFEQCLATQWPGLYGKDVNVEAEFERRFVSAREHRALLQLYFPPWIRRVSEQSAFITIAGELKVDHARAINALGLRKCGKFIIPSGWKDAILERLDALGVNGYTLGVGDSSVETIAGDIVLERQTRRAP